MADTGLAISVESSCITDAVVELMLAHERLAKRHGAAFRALERSIEAIADDFSGCIETYWMGDGSIMAAPAGRLTEALREARRLGVLRC